MYEAMKFDHLLGITGFSDKLLTTHFKLYEGYINNINLLNDHVSKTEVSGKNPQFAEIKRRMGWEWNGMRLHELYFDNMTKETGTKDAAESLQKKMNEDFGSYDAWEKDFLATGGMRGIGWAILYYDPQAHRLTNQWVEEHNMNHMAGCVPLLILDCFEHAYVMDYGMERPEYIKAFFNVLDWKVLAERFDRASKTV